MQRSRTLLAIFFALVGIMILGDAKAVVLAERSKGFTDIVAGSEQGAAIREMAALGILRGYQNGAFGPNDALTRAQAALILQRLNRGILRQLHLQMEEVRSTLNLGTCGDGTMQTGEECDDGNTTGLDGCSSECLKETLMDGCGIRDIGERFAADDGCNSCVCTSEGILCTMMACPVPEAPQPEEPSEPEPTPEPVLPTPDPNAQPLCGNGICEIKENDIPPDRRFHCPQDCTGAPVRRQCEGFKKEFLDDAAASRACNSSDDCIIIAQRCPFITCGEAINKSAYPSLALKLAETLSACRREGDPTQCLLCPASSPYCEAGRCVVKQVGK